MVLVEVSVLTVAMWLQVIHKHFYLKRTDIMCQCEEWIADIQQYSSDKRVGRTMSHHAAALKVSCPFCSRGGSPSPSQLMLLFLQRHTAQLREELLKLPCPSGLDADPDEFSERSAALILKELPSQDAEKPGGSQDNQCGEG